MASLHGRPAGRTRPSNPVEKHSTKEPRREAPSSPKRGRSDRPRPSTAKSSNATPTHLRSIASVATNLPARLSSFVGRDREVTALANLVAGSRLVTLVGPAGVGKSRLALRVAEATAAEFPDGVSLVELASVSEAKLVPQVVASALGVPQERGVPVTRSLVGYLAQRRSLLILDNCEHLIGSSAALVETLIEACPELSVLATSQEPLGIRGEVVWRVPPLSVPTRDEVLSSDGLEAFDSVRLFVERAAAATPGFALSPQVAPAVADVCRRLDGIPLAIEFAAARVDIMSPAEIAQRLDDGFGLLHRASRGGPERHQTLDAALSWSYGLLSEPERTLLQRLAVFSGGFSLAAAEKVCSGGAVGGGHVLPLLTALVAKSFVMADVTASPARYRLLETVRHHAWSRAEEAGEEGALRAAHGEWFAGFAEEAERGLAGSDQGDWLVRLEAEHDNLRAAISSATSAARGDIALRLTSALIPFWRLRGHFGEARTRLEAALAPTKGADKALRAKALWGVGLFAVMAGDLQAAVDNAEAALELARRTDDRRISARALNVVGLAAVMRGEPAAALPLLDEAISLARQAGDSWCLADSLARSGQTHLALGEPVAALPCFEDSLQVSRAAGERQTVVTGLSGMGWAHMARGDHREAEAVMRQALALAEELKQSFETADTLVFLGDLVRLRAEYGEARALLERALGLARTIDSVAMASRALGGLGRVTLAEDRPAEARALFEQAAAAAREANVPFILARSLEGLAMSRWQEGDGAGAAEVYEEVLAMTRRSGDQEGVASALHELGNLARDRGDFDRAATLHHEALEIRSRVGGRGRAAGSLRALAGLAAAQGAAAMATRVFAAAHALDEAVGVPSTKSHSATSRYEADLALVRSELSPEQFEAAWAKGAALSEEEAVAYARRGRGSRDRPSTGWASLTPAEREVVSLVQQGLTNPEIAERLFISPRTVGGHLSHIFTKLDITSRKELRRAAGGG